MAAEIKMEGDYKGFTIKYRATGFDIIEGDVLVSSSHTSVPAAKAWIDNQDKTKYRKQPCIVWDTWEGEHIGASATSVTTTTWGRPEIWVTVPGSRKKRRKLLQHQVFQNTTQNWELVGTMKRLSEEITRLQDERNQLERTLVPIDLASILPEKNDAEDDSPVSA